VHLISIRNSDLDLTNNILFSFYPLSFLFIFHFSFLFRDRRSTKDRERVAEEMAKSEEQRKQMEVETIAMVQERRKLEGLVAMQKAGKRGKKSGRTKKSKGNKKEFGISKAAVPIEILLPATNAKTTVHKKSQSFERHSSPEGKEYFSNIETKKTTWKVPKGGIVQKTGK